MLLISAIVMCPGGLVKIAETAMTKSQLMLAFFMIVGGEWLLSMNSSSRGKILQ